MTDGIDRHAYDPAVYDVLHRLLYQEHRQLSLEESMASGANCSCGWVADGLGPFGQFQRHLDEVSRER